MSNVKIAKQQVVVLSADSPSLSHFRAQQARINDPRGSFALSARRHAELADEMCDRCRGNVATVCTHGAEQLREIAIQDFHAAERARYEQQRANNARR